MKTLKSLFMLCAGLSFCACSSDNEPQLPEGTGAVTVRIADPISTRMVDGALDDLDNEANTEIVNGDITLTLTHTGQGGTVTKTMAYNSGTNKYTVDGHDVTVSGTDLVYTFYNIGQPTGLTASMYGGVASYATKKITGDTPELQVAADRIPVFGDDNGFRKTGDVVNDGNDDYVEWETTVTMDIPVARLEMQIAVGNDFEGFSSIKLAGAYLDMVKPTESGTVTNYYLQYDNSSTAKATATDGNDRFAILCDNYFEAEGDVKDDATVILGTGAVSMLPAADQYFAYNFYPEGATPDFKLCLNVVSNDVNNPIPAIQYAIVKFVEDDGQGGTTPITFEKGSIYRVTNLTLNGSNIQVDEDGTDLAYALTATVVRAKWNIVTTVNGTWEQ